jgi:hypothetical protein
VWRFDTTARVRAATRILGAFAVAAVVWQVGSGAARPDLAYAALPLLASLYAEADIVRRVTAASFNAYRGTASLMAWTAMAVVLHVAATKLRIGSSENLLLSAAIACAVFAMRAAIVLAAPAASARFPALRRYAALAADHAFFAISMTAVAVMVPLLLGSSDSAAEYVANVAFQSLVFGFVARLYRYATGRG